MVGFRCSTRLLIFKLVATLLVAAAMLAPFFQTDQGVHVLGSLAGLSGPLIGVIVIGFLVLIALYCRTIQRLLERLRPESRTMRPLEVWLMFVPFFNIVEDFFIIGALTCSLRNEAGRNPALAGLKYFGAVAGFGWCVAQAASLFPGRAGEAIAALAILFWLWHWVFLIRVSRRLGSREPKPLNS